MLPLILGLILFLCLAETPYARLFRAVIVVVPALLAASFAAQYASALSPQLAKLLAYFVVAAGLGWITRSRNVMAHLLVLWGALDITGYVLLGTLPGWSEYLTDGNAFLFIVTLPVSAIVNFRAMRGDPVVGT